MGNRDKTCEIQGSNEQKRAKEKKVEVTGTEYCNNKKGKGVNVVIKENEESEKKGEECKPTDEKVREMDENSKERSKVKVEDKPVGSRENIRKVQEKDNNS